MGGCMCVSSFLKYSKICDGYSEYLKDMPVTEQIVLLLDSINHYVNSFGN